MRYKVQYMCQPVGGQAALSVLHHQGEQGGLGGPGPCTRHYTRTIWQPDRVTVPARDSSRYGTISHERAVATSLDFVVPVLLWNSFGHQHFVQVVPGKRKK